MDRRQFLQLLGGIAALGMMEGCGRVAPPATEERASTDSEPSHLHPAGSAWKQNLSFSSGDTPVIAIARTSWHPQAVISSRLLPMEHPEKITVHHEGNPQPNHDKSIAAVAAKLRMIQGEHFHRLHAGDIGYHYIIDREGRLWEGRPIRYQGAHVAGQNKNNIGIVLLGNYDIQTPTAPQLSTLYHLCTTLVHGYRIPPQRIYGHGELATTRCPGRYLLPYVRQMRQRIA